MLNIMYEYMADIDLPLEYTEEFLLLIPAQRAMVNRLMNDGVISSYAVSIEKGKLWMMVIAEDESSVAGLIDSFPIAAFLKYEIHRLTFHDSARSKMPSFSLN